MSYHTWHDYGYGICTDEISANTTVEKIENLLALAPKFRDVIHSSFDEGEEPLEVSDYEDVGAGNLAAILAEVISEAEGIDFTPTENYDGESYLLYIARYPWAMTAKDAALTEKGIEEILHKYISILTDAKVDVGYQEVENGG
jgi:hypothetical protein